MAISKGKEEYRINYGDNIIAFGISHSMDEMESCLCNEVYNRLYDISEIDDLVYRLQDTGFDEDIIKKKLFLAHEVKEWEIGEAYAQAYAEVNLSSIIPWHISRDIKKPGSSLPGADIVGFRLNDDDARFLFGEVKTSSEGKYPPSLMYGNTGLKKQLEDLCEDKDLITKLIEYLAYRLKATPLWDQYKQACTHFLCNDKDVHILGVLIRDIKPSEKDLSTRVKVLRKHAKNGRTIELVGIYVPTNEIKRFPKTIRDECERRSAANA